LIGEGLRLDGRLEEARRATQQGIEIATRVRYWYAVALGERIAARIARDGGDAAVAVAGLRSRAGRVRSDWRAIRDQADSWITPRRIVSKVEHHVGELFPRVGFIVTNLRLPNRAVVRFNSKRGTAEQWIKEGKRAAHWTRSSCHRFQANEVRLQLSVLA
jgi:hypothetical protein